MINDNNGQDVINNFMSTVKPAVRAKVLEIKKDIDFDENSEFDDEFLVKLLALQTLGNIAKKKLHDLVYNNVKFVSKNDDYYDSEEDNNNPMRPR